MTDHQKTEKFYGRRKGRPLRKQQSRVMEDLLPRLRVDGADGPVDLAGLFPAPRREHWLEIGFGGGEHLAWQAAHNPDVALIGCEPFQNGVARLLMEVEEKGLENVRVCPDDARPLLDALGEGVIDRAFILFADPWPKKRHHPRRFINADNLVRLARILKDGALLRIASDHAGYVRWILAHITANGNFDWLDEGSSDWNRREEDWPATRYEQKALAGRPYYLRFRRRSRG